MKPPLELPAGYDKTLPDSSASNATSATSVRASFKIFQLSTVNEDRQEWQVWLPFQAHSDLFCRSELSLHISTTLRWTDSRIASATPCLGPFQPSVADSIWKPSLTIYRSTFARTVESHVGFVQGSNGKPFHLEYWTESHVGFKCAMDFSRYPFDSQVCKFVAGSLVTSANNSLVFESGSVSRQAGRYSKDKVYNMEYEPLDATEDLLDDYYPAGYRRSYTGFAVKLKRPIMSHLLNTFLPSFAIVITDSARYQRTQSCRKAPPRRKLLKSLGFLPAGKPAGLWAL